MKHRNRRRTYVAGGFSKTERRRRSWADRQDWAFYTGHNRRRRRLHRLRSFQEFGDIFYPARRLVRIDWPDAPLTRAFLGARP